MILTSKDLDDLIKLRIALEKIFDKYLPNYDYIFTEDEENAWFQNETSYTKRIFTKIPVLENQTKTIQFPLKGAV